MIENYNLKFDGHKDAYDVMTKYIKTLKGVPGLSCEVGVRRAGGTVVMLQAFRENEDNRTHIAIDPYGNIIYNDIVGPHRSDYTNDMRNETLTELYRYCKDKRFNVIFFNLEDSEFYNRFPDGVPIYDQEKRIENQYCCVHIDGQHDLPNVMNAAKFFNERVSKGGYLFFDNTNHYKHASVDEYCLENGFEFLEEVSHKRVYRKIK